jgi:Raf kinase inhibitor-like YbhB/YbcL family protein
VKLGGIEEGKPINEKFAYCVADGKGATKDGGNISPAINWSGAPDGTKSYAVIVVDRDVPANFDSANKEGKVIQADAPRRDFYHWVQVNIPAAVTSLAENTNTVGMGGNNDFGAGSKGKSGYDGPCPPWNDERLHHYHFIVYALDTPTLGLNMPFSGKQAEDAMNGHILAKGEVVGTYTTNQNMLTGK